MKAGDDHRPDDAVIVSADQFNAAGIAKDALKSTRYAKVMNACRNRNWSETTMPNAINTHSKYVVQVGVNCQTKRSKDRTVDEGAIHKHLHAHIAKYTDSRGYFVNQDFLDALIQSDAPKAEIEKLREGSLIPHTTFRWGTGAKNDCGKNVVTEDNSVPVHGGKGDQKFQRKVIDSKYPDFLNAAQRSLQQHFERPISWGLFEKELQKYLLETGHTPAYSTYITCVDPVGPEGPVLIDPLKYTAFNNRRVPFTISGIGGLPNAGLTGLRAITNQTPPGGRIVLVHGTHIGIDEFGSLGQSNIYDEASGIHLKIPSSEPVISTYKRLLTLNESEKKANRHLDVGLHELQTVLRPHMETLKYTVDEPFIDLPKILYSEQRKRLLHIAEKAIDGKAVIIGFIRIVMPPSEDDRVIIKNVDFVLPRSQRNTTVTRIVHHSIGPDDVTTAELTADNMSLTKIDPDSEENIQVIVTVDWLADKTTYFTDRLTKLHCSQFANIEAEKAVSDSINNISDRERAKRTESKAKLAHDKRVADDWNLDKNSTHPMALQKFRGLAMYFRWSKLVRRMLNVVRLKEVDTDWDLDPSTRRDAKKKFGKLFMVMRWKGFIDRYLAQHNKRERKELLRYY